MDVATLDQIRASIPALSKTVYLNTGWSGPSPTPVVDAIIDWLRWEAEEGPTAPHVMSRGFKQSHEAKVAISRVFGASPAEIALVENTTEGLNLVVNGVDWQPGDEVVTCTFEHPSVLLPLYLLRDRRSIPLRFVHLSVEDDAATIVRKFEEEITQQTRLVAISHISFNHGVRLPLEGIVEVAHAAGAEVMVDGAQTAGQIAIDLHGSGVDYYAFTGHKWTLGPDGVGFLYVRRDKLPALETSKVYMPAAAAFDVYGGWTPRRDDASKYELTTRSPALLAGYLKALEIYEGRGIAWVEERTRSLGLSLRSRLATIAGVELVSPNDPDTACGLVCFRVSGIGNQALVQKLWERKKIVSRFVPFPDPGVTRAACHYFNTDDELNVFAFEIARIASEQ